MYSLLYNSWPELLVKFQHAMSRFSGVINAHQPSVQTLYPVLIFDLFSLTGPSAINILKINHIVLSIRQGEMRSQNRIRLGYIHELQLLNG